MVFVAIWKNVILGLPKDYLTSKGWKADLEETVGDFKDAKILVKRALGLSYYGLPKLSPRGEMPSKELKDFCWEASALRFDSDREFQIYAVTHGFPLGRCVVGYGRNARKYDDSF